MVYVVYQIFYEKLMEDVGSGANIIGVYAKLEDATNTRDRIMQEDLEYGYELKGDSRLVWKTDSRVYYDLIIKPEKLR